MAERERPPLWKRLLAIADTATLALTDQWQTWLRAAQRRLRQTDLTVVFPASNILEPQALIRQVVTTTLETPARLEMPVIASGIIDEAGAAAVGQLARTLPAPPFVAGLPETEQWIAQHTGSRIVGIMDTTMQTVRQTLQEGIRERTPVRELMRQLRGQTGLTPRQAGAIEKQAAKWQAEGMRAGPLQKAVKQLQERALRQRAETIARTEALAYTNYAAHQAVVQYVRRGVLDEASVVRQWVFTTDSKCCFCAGTMVETPQGARPIEQLRPGEIVVTHEGQQQLLATMVRPFAGLLVCVETTGDQLVIMTDDHPVLVGGEWCEAATLRPGDVLQPLHEDVLHVRTVLHVCLQDMQNGPAVLGEEGISSGFFGRVGMPIDSIDFNGDFQVRQGEIQTIPPYGIFLHEGNLYRGEGFSHQALWGGFTCEGAIASTRTESSFFHHARDHAPCFPAGLAGDMMGRATADFRTIAACIRDVGRFHKAGATSRTVMIDRLGSLAGTRTDCIAMGDGSGDGEWFLTDGAGFLNECTCTRRIIAGSGAKEEPLTGGPIKRDSALLTVRIWGDVSVERKALCRTIRSFSMQACSAAEVFITIGTLISKRHHPVLRKILDEYSLNYSIPVYDITVEKAHTFYAGGFLVHNCDGCSEIPGMNPNGVGLNEEFQTPFGPHLLPPAHPRCRCTVSTTTNRG